MITLRVVAGRLALALGCALSLFAAAPAQSQQADSAKKPAPPPAPPAPAGPQVSGLLVADFRSGGPKGSRAENRFEIDRVYLTVVAPAGERLLVRLTTDIFQQTSPPADAYYGGWVVRAKYAYLQYDFLRGAPGALAANARFGLVHNPVIDPEEQYWIRPLSPVAVELAGFFSSADAGAATTVTLPNKVGEAYLLVANGNGYASRETDRFKDVGARLTLTPFSHGSSILKSLAISPWYYKGARASDFVARRGTVLAVSGARKKDRYGVLVGLKDPRFSLAAQLAMRSDQVETADTLAATAPTVSDRNNSLVSVHSVIRPFAFASATPRWPVLLVFRADRRPDVNANTYSRFLVGGIGYELSKKATVYLDWQSLQPQAGSRGPDTKTYFMHIVGNF